MRSRGGARFGRYRGGSAVTWTPASGPKGVSAQSACRHASAEPGGLGHRVELGRDGRSGGATAAAGCPAR